MESTVSELEKILGSENVSTDEADLISHSRDASEFVGKPHVVVWPRSTEQVCRVLELASERGVPVTPRGSGTSVTGGPVPVRGGILMVLTRMNRVLEVDVAGMQALVECGTTWAGLNEALSRYRLFAPSDPISWDPCTVGGCVAEGRVGARSLGYGALRDWVLGLEVALPSGEALRVGGETIRPRGYDLTRLFVGSEGTLGVITKVRLRLFPRPRHRQLLIAYMDSMEDACRAVYHVLDLGLEPSAAEAVDAAALEAASRRLGVEVPRCGAMLTLEFDGRTRWSVRSEVRSAGGVCTRLGGSVKAVEPPEAQEAVWRLLAIAPHASSPDALHLELSIPPSKLEDAIPLLREVASRRGLRISIMGYVGLGQIRLVLPSGAGDAANEIIEAAWKLGGAPGEHGAGLRFAHLTASRELQLMRGFKRLLDPRGIMNPGKVFGHEAAPVR